MPITINGHTVEPGCYCEGHRGQYGPDHVYDLAVGFGFPERLSDNMHRLRQLAERRDERFWAAYHDPHTANRRHVLRIMANAPGSPYKLVPTSPDDPEFYDQPNHSYWEYRHWLMDDIVDWLNDHTVRGTWGWDDGEFFLEYADDPDASYLWVCQDCYMAHHGYDVENPDDEPLGKLDHEHWHYADAHDDERRFGETGYDEFSSVSCDGCGTHLAGARHRLVMWANEASQESYLTVMAQGYIECALSSSTYEEDGITENMDDFDSDDIDMDSKQSMIKECEDFMKAEWAYVCDLDPAQVGHDFWLTRNRHGTGFWDRGHAEWLGRHLSDAAHVYGEANLYLGDDGVVYHS